MSRSVLIVDDHAVFRRVAWALLEAEGFAVVGEAADGETALTEAARLRPGLVLLDIQLPDLDGFEVAARLAGLADSPAVVLTSSRRPERAAVFVEERPHDQAVHHRRRLWLR